MNLVAKIKRLEMEAAERDKRIAALEARIEALEPKQSIEWVTGVWPPPLAKVTDWSSLKNAAAMHNPKAYEAGWAEIHESGQPMTDEQERQLMEMFRRVLAGPKKRKPRAKPSTTE